MYTRACQGVGSKWSVALSVLFALILAMLLNPSAAHAKGYSNCNTAPYGYVCMQANGTLSGSQQYFPNNYVNDYSVVRAKYDNSFICNYKASVTVTNFSSGNRYTLYSPFYRRCSAGRVQLFWYPKRRFTPGTRLCARFYEYGRQQGSTPCIYIIR